MAVPRMTRDPAGREMSVEERLRRLELRSRGAVAPVIGQAQQWAIKGAVSTTLELPPIFIVVLDEDYDFGFQTDGVDGEGPLAPGPHLQAEEVYLIGVWYYLGQGTSATFQIRDAPAGGGSQLGSNFTAHSTFGGAGRTDWGGVRVYDGQRLHLRCTAISGAPRIVTVAPVLAHLYGPAS